MTVAGGPVITFTGLQERMDEQTQLTFTVSASDPGNPQAQITLAAPTLPGGATFNSATGLFTWTPTESQGPNIFDATFTATDDNNPSLTDTKTVSITVDEVNRAPDLAAIGDRSIEPQTEASFTVTASDPDDPANTVTLSVSDLPEGAVFDADTGVFSWRPNLDQGPGVYSITFTATDDGMPSLSDSETITITVTGEDNAKFFVAAHANNSHDRIFYYGDKGDYIQSSEIASKNKNARGIATNLVGDRFWVIDGNKNVYVYDGDGQAIGWWKANSLNQPVGITVHGNDIWIVDEAMNKVYMYEGAASLDANGYNGSVSPDSQFLLTKGNKNPTDLVTNGLQIWVTNDHAKKNEVFVYSMAGTPQGRWELDPRNDSPSGITLNPSGGTELWTVDRSSRRVFAYPDAQTWVKGSHPADDKTSFDLNVGNVLPEGIADPDADPPGDAKDDAQPVTLTPGVTTSISELIGNGLHGDQDVDFYEVSLFAGETLMIDIDTALSNLDSYVRIFDNIGVEKNVDEGYGVPPVNFTAVTAGNYFVGVSDVGNISYSALTSPSGVSADTGTYTIDLTTVAETPGDTLSTAKDVTLTLNKYEFANIGDNNYAVADVDLYRIHLAAGEALIAQTIGGEFSDLDTYLRIFEPDGDELASDNDGGTGTDSRIDFVAPSDSNYFVGVSSYANTAYDPEVADSGVPGSTTGDFTLQLALDLTNDVVGDTISTARNVTLTSGITENEYAEIGNGGKGGLDIDMFAVTLTAGQELTIDVDTPTGSLDSYLRLFDSAGIELAADDGYGTADPILTHVAIHTSTVYIGVTSVGNSSYDAVTGNGSTGTTTGPFTLKLTAVDPPPDEIGDTIATSKRVALPNIGDTTLQTTLGDGTLGGADVDMFAFFGVEGQIITIDLDTPDSDLDTHLRLFDKDGDELLSNNDDGVDTDSKLVYTVAESGMLYAGVSADPNSSYDPDQADSGAGNTIGVFDVKFTVAMVSTDWLGDTTTAAEPLTLIPGELTAVAGHVGNGQFGNADIDMVSFTLEAGQQLFVDVDVAFNVASEFDLNSYVRLFDDQGDELAADGEDGYGMGAGARITYAAPTNGTYFVGVTSFGNSVYSADDASNRTAGNSSGDFIVRLGATALPVGPDVAAYTDMAGTIELSQGGNVLDFGATAHNNPIRRNVFLRNSGGGPLAVSSITLPAGFTVVTAATAFTIHADGNRAVVIEMDADTVGTQSGEVVVYSNDPDEPELRFDISGEVTAPALDAVNDAYVGIVPSVETQLDVLENDLGTGITITNATASSGTVQISTDGLTLLYTGTASFELATLSYTISDGLTSDTASVSVQESLPPVAVDDEYLDVEEGFTANLYVLDNDVDPDGDALSISSFTPPASGTVVNHGHYLAYTASPGYQGDTFDYTVVDPAGHQSTATVIVAPPGLLEPDLRVDFNRLQDVTQSMAFEYHRTSFHDADKRLFADLNVSNVGTYSVRGPVLLGVKDITHPFVTVGDADGFSPEGIPYYNITDLVIDQSGVMFSPNAISENIELRFDNPQQEQFRYELVVWAFLNEGPVFETVPRGEALAGTIYQYHADAPDPDHDAVTYSLVSGPENMTVFAASGLVSWQTATADIGTHSVTIRAEDPYGAADEQEFIISVADFSNRPPRFTSDPIADGNVDQTYEYQLAAFDPDIDPLAFSIVDGPEGLAIAHSERGLIQWTPTADLVGQTVEVTAKVEDGRGGEALHDFQIYISPDPFNHPPIFVSQPDTEFILPATSTSDPVGEIAPGFIDVGLDDGEVLNETISITLPENSTPYGKADVFLLFDDTGSFASRATSLADSFQEVIAALGTDYPTTDFAFGVGRFEDFSNYVPQKVSRPFILNQPVAEADADGFAQAIEEALDRTAPGRGGDTTESAIEALYQAATGVGFDGNGDGDLFDSGAAGIMLTQLTPGSSGDVPPFSSYLFDPMGTLAPASGSLGGVGFRAESLPIILLGTDDGTRFKKSEPIIDPIQGVDGAELPLAHFLHRSEFDVPSDAAAEIQQTVSALNDLGALVIGIGANSSYNPYDAGDPNAAPRVVLEALATLTGATNQSDQSIESGITGDPIDPGDPLYFKLSNITNSSAIAATISAAVNAAITSTAFDITVEGTESGLLNNLSGFQFGVMSSETVEFDVQLIGDGQAHSFDLQVVSDTGVVLGSIPVIIRSLYRYDADAVDADDDTLTYSLVGETHGAEIDPETGKLNWAPSQTGDYEFTASVIDGRGGEDIQTWTVSVLESSANNADPVLDPVGPLTYEVERTYSVDVDATDADGDQIQFRLVDDPAGGAPLPDGVSIDSTTGVIDWTPEIGQVGSHSVKVQAIDGRGGSDDIIVSIDVVLPDGFDNSPPEITSTPVKGAAVDSVYRYDVTATDPDDDAIVYDLPFAPDGMAINPVTGQIAWRPDFDQFGTHTVYVRAKDASNGYDLQVFDLLVSTSNDAPIFVSTPIEEAVIGIAYEYQAEATDANGDTITYSIDPVADVAGFDIDPSGLITWALPVAGTHRIAVLADDLRGGQTFQFFAVNVGTNAPPRITSTPTGPALVGVEFPYLIEYEDPNPGDTVTLSLDQDSIDRGIDLTGDSLTWTPQLEGDFEITITADDGNGGWGTQTFTLPVRAVVVPSLPPRITSTPTGPAYLGETWEYEIVATDDDDDDNTLIYSLIEPTPIPGRIEINGHTVTWDPIAGEVPDGLSFIVRVEDLQGSYVEQTFTVPALATPPVNDPPRITSIPTGPALIDQPYEYTVVAHDPNGDDLSYGLVTPPTGVTIDSDSGLMQVTPDTAGDLTITVSASDGKGGSATQTFTLPVIDPDNLPVNEAPVITTEPDGPAYVGVEWDYTITATDADNDDATLIYSLVQPLDTAGVAFDPTTRIVTWTPTEIGSLNFVLRVADPDGGYADQLFTLPAVKLNQRPSITSLPTGPAFVDQLYQYQVTADDLDVGDLLTFSLVDPPSNLSIGPQSGTLLFTPTETGEIDIIVVVDDGNGGQAAQFFTLPIVDPPPPVGGNLPPEFTTSPPGPVIVGNTWTYVFDGTDPDDIDSTLVYTLETPGLPYSGNGAVAFNASTKTLTWDPTDEGEQTFTLRVTDGATNYAEQTITVPAIIPVIINQPPEITSIPTGPAVVGENYEYQVTASDPDFGDVLTYSLVNPPNDLSIDSDSGLMQITPTVSGSLDIAIVVDDGNGGRSTQSFTLPVINPDLPPQFTTDPSGPAIIGEGPWEYMFDATDVEDVDSTLIYSLTTPSLPVGNGTVDFNATTKTITWDPTVVGEITFTLRVTDSGDNYAEQTFTMPAVLPAAQNAPPEITSIPTGPAVVGDEYEYQVVANDPDAGDSLTYHLVNPPSNLSIGAASGLLEFTPTVSGSLEIAVVVDDGNGGTATQIFTLPIVDPPSPNGDAPPDIHQRHRPVLRSSVKVRGATRSTRPI